MATTVERKCEYCHSKTNIKQRCSKCKKCYYCNRECQNAHWKISHKKQCKLRKEMNDNQWNEYNEQYMNELANNDENITDQVSQMLTLQRINAIKSLDANLNSNKKVKKDKEDSGNATDQNPFFKHKHISHDIKYKILTYLKEMEIHSIMSNIDCEWNKLCRNTFNHVQFNYTFDSYLNKLFDDWNCGDTTVYVQCPWNLLWTKGIGTWHDYGLDVTVKFKEYNPFNCNSTKNDHDSNEMSSSNTSDITNMCVCFEISDERSCNNKTPPYLDVAPLNTIDKVAINNRQMIIDLTTNNQMVDIDPFNRPLVQVEMPFTAENPLILVKIINHRSPRDELKLWRNSFAPNEWRCGIIDTYAMDLMFPDWKTNENSSYQIAVLIDVTEILHYHDDSRSTTAPSYYLNQFYNLYRYGNNRYFTRIWFHPNKKILFSGCHYRRAQSPKKNYPIKRYTYSSTHDFDFHLDEMFSKPMTVAKSGRISLCPNDLSLSSLGPSGIPIHEVLTNYLITIKSNEKQSQNENKNKNENENDCQLELTFDKLITCEEYSDKVMLFRDFDGYWIRCFIVSDAQKTVSDCDDCKYSKLVCESLNENVNDDDHECQSQCYYYPNWQLSKFKLMEKKHQMFYFYDFKATFCRKLLKFDCRYLMEQIGCCDIDDFVAISVDVKPKIFAIKVSKKDPYFQEFINVGNYNNIESNDHISMAEGYNSNQVIELKFLEDKWREGAIYVDKEDFSYLSYGLNEFLFDCDRQFEIDIDITQEFNQFQENFIKPQWLLKYSKQENEWSNRKYLVNHTSSITWEKEDDRIFFSCFVHLDDQQQVAISGTHVTCKY